MQKMGDERSEKKAVKDKIREGINRDMRPADGCHAVELFANVKYEENSKAVSSYFRLLAHKSMQMHCSANVFTYC